MTRDEAGEAGEAGEVGEVGEACSCSGLSLPVSHVECGPARVERGDLVALGVRFCNGGWLPGPPCTARATLVARNDAGLEWFCCEAHGGGAVELVPLDEWRRLRGLG